jgi:hypothetical protein
MGTYAPTLPPSSVGMADPHMKHMQPDPFHKPRNICYSATGEYICLPAPPFLLFRSFLTTTTSTMKCHKPGTDQAVSLTVYANGIPCKEYDVLTGDTDPNTVECYIPVSVGDELTIRGTFTGSILHGAIDLLADGSFLADQRFEGSKNGDLKHHMKKKFAFTSVLDVPKPEGTTSELLPKLAVEGNLHVKKIREQKHDSVSGMWKGKLGAGTLAAVVSLNQDTRENYFDKYPSITCGDWAAFSHAQGTSNAGIEPVHELEVRVLSSSPNAAKQGRHRRHHDNSRFGKEPWAKIIFYYRSAKALEAAGCQESSKDESHSLGPWRGSRKFVAAEPQPKKTKNGKRNAEGVNEDEKTPGASINGSGRRSSLFTTPAPIKDEPSPEAEETPRETQHGLQPRQATSTPQFTAINWVPSPNAAPPSSGGKKKLFGNEFPKSNPNSPASQHGFTQNQAPDGSFAGLLQEFQQAVQGQRAPVARMAEPVAEEQREEQKDETSDPHDAPRIDSTEGHSIPQLEEEIQESAPAEGLVAPGVDEQIEQHNDESTGNSDPQDQSQITSTKGQAISQSAVEILETRNQPELPDNDTLPPAAAETHQETEISHPHDEDQLDSTKGQPVPSLSAEIKENVATSQPELTDVENQIAAAETRHWANNSHPHDASPLDSTKGQSIQALSSRILENIRPEGIELFALREACGVPNTKEDKITFMQAVHQVASKRDDRYYLKHSNENNGARRVDGGDGSQQQELDSKRRDSITNVGKPAAPSPRPQTKWARSTSAKGEASIITYGRIKKVEEDEEQEGKKEDFLKPTKEPSTSLPPSTPTPNPLKRSFESTVLQSRESTPGGSSSSKRRRLEEMQARKAALKARAEKAAARKAAAQRELEDAKKRKEEEEREFRKQLEAEEKEIEELEKAAEADELEALRMEDERKGLEEDGEIE